MDSGAEGDGGVDGGVAVLEMGTAAWTTEASNLVG